MLRAASESGSLNPSTSRWLFYDHLVSCNCKPSLCGPGGEGLSAGCGEHPVLAGGPGLRHRRVRQAGEGEPAVYIYSGGHEAEQVR